MSLHPLASAMLLICKVMALVFNGGAAKPGFSAGEWNKDISTILLHDSARSYLGEGRVNNVCVCIAVHQEFSGNRLLLKQVLCHHTTQAVLRLRQHLQLVSVSFFRVLLR